MKASPGTVKDGEKKDKILWEAAKDFEAMFMSYIIKTMQGSLPEGNLTQNGLPGIMFNQVMGKAMVAGGGIETEIQSGRKCFAGLMLFVPGMCQL